MITYEELLKEVKEKISIERFNHSIGVVKRAVEYAKIYNVDIETVKLTAIAHDIAKEMTKEEKEKYQLSFDDIEILNQNLHHAKIGAIICKEKYNFTDDMTNAIKYHTTGRENMSILEKIIYLADATEPGRDYIDLEYYVDLSKTNIDKAVLEVSEWCIKNLLNKNSIIHLDTIKCYNYYNKLAKNTKKNLT